MTRIKICGVTRPDDARNAAVLGAAAVGLNFHAESPRVVTPEQAARIIDVLPLFVTSVGVFVNYPDPQALEDFAISLGLAAVQLHGDESPEYCSMITRVKVIKALRVGEASRFRISPTTASPVSCWTRTGVALTVEPGRRSTGTRPQVQMHLVTSSSRVG